MADTVILSAPGGRSLETRIVGPSDGQVVLFHHGTPGVGLPSPELLDAVASRKLRYVAFARAGYGGSTRRPERNVADVAEDAAAVRAADAPA